MKWFAAGPRPAADESSSEDIVHDGACNILEERPAPDEQRAKRIIILMLLVGGFYSHSY